MASGNPLLPTLSELHDEEAPPPVKRKLEVVDQGGMPTSTTSPQFPSWLEGHRLKFRYQEKGYILPFLPTDTIGHLTTQIAESTGLPCIVEDEDEFRYTDGITLNLVTVPFRICIGNSKSMISEAGPGLMQPANEVNKQIESTNDVEPAMNADRQIPYGRVSNVRQVIDLLSFVHEQMRKGKTVNGALKKTKKDRKTIDRFLNIYYLYFQNRAKLTELERNWQGDGKPGGLQGLDEKAKKDIDWDQLKKLFDDGTVANFGTKKDN